MIEYLGVHFIQHILFAICYTGMRTSCGINRRKRRMRQLQLKQRATLNEKASLNERKEEGRFDTYEQSNYKSIRRNVCWTSQCCYSKHMVHLDWISYSTHHIVTRSSSSSNNLSTHIRTLPTCYLNWQYFLML